MTSLHEDRELLAAFRAGESKALDRVYRFYAPMVHTLLRNGFMLGDGDPRRRFCGCQSEHDSEELLQETFLRAFAPKARLAYDGLRPYRSYLFRIARNLVIDELRKKRPRLTTTLEDEAKAVEDPTPSPETRVRDQEVGVLLNEFRAGLEGLERQVFELRFVEQLEQRQLSARLGRSLYKVRAVEKRLRKRLLQVARQHGYLTAVSPPGVGP